MNVALTPVFIPASGWVADRYSTQTVFRATIAVFTRGPVLRGRGDIQRSWPAPASCRASAGQ